LVVKKSPDALMSEMNSWATVALRNGWGGAWLNLTGHGLGSYFERLPSFKPQSARNKLLRVAELKLAPST
jgi:hypothetical protein